MDQEAVGREAAEVFLPADREDPEDFPLRLEGGADSVPVASEETEDRPAEDREVVPEFTWVAVTDQRDHI